MESVRNIPDIEGETGKYNDSLVLLHKLPKEIWIKVFDATTSAKDLESLWNSSQFFRKLLNSRRTESLFPKLWRIIDGMYHNMCLNDELAGQRLKSILMMRLVCRCWRDTIDHFYEDTRHHYKLTGDPMEKRHEISFNFWNLNGFLSHSTNATGRFMRFFEYSHGKENENRNPFFGRSVKLYTGLHMNDDNDVPDYQHNFFALLEKYGRHIWYLKVDVFDNFAMTCMWYDNLIEYLRMMPNLKYISIKFHAQHWMGMDISHMLSRIIGDVDTISVPTLRNLEFLRIEQLPIALVNAIVRANSHVAALEIDHERISFEHDILSIVRSTYLTQLSIKIYSIDAFEQLEKCEANWRLEKLGLSFSESVHIEWSRIFKLLEMKCGLTLTNLVLQLPRWKKLGKMTKKALKECKALRINLCSLRSLSMKMDNLANVDFLLPLKGTLEFLKLEMRYNNSVAQKFKKIFVSKKKRQTIEFIGYAEKIMESNIWEVLPKLEHFDISERIRFREGVIFKVNWCERRERSYSRSNENTVNCSK